MHISENYSINFINIQLCDSYKSIIKYKNSSKKTWKFNSINRTWKMKAIFHFFGDYIFNHVQFREINWNDSVDLLKPSSCWLSSNGTPRSATAASLSCCKSTPLTWLLWPSHGAEGADALQNNLYLRVSRHPPEVR